MRNTVKDSWLSWGAFALSITALVFALVAYLNTQATPDVSQAVSQVQTSLSQEINQMELDNPQLTSAEFDQQIDAVRDTLSREYQDSRTDVRQAWQDVDSQLEQFQIQAREDLATALVDFNQYIADLSQDIAPE